MLELALSISRIEYVDDHMMKNSNKGGHDGKR